VAGNVNAKNTFKLIEKYFGSIKDLSKSKKEKVSESQKNPQIKILQKKTDQTHLVLGVRTFPVSDKRNITLQVLDGVLGQGMSSRLFQKLREEMGVCYYAKSSTNQFTDHGDFVVFAGVDPKRVAEAVSAILNEFRKLRDELVSDVELSKVKESLVGNLYMGLESSDAVASFIGEQEVIHKETKTPEEIEHKVRAVKAEDIRKLAREIFTNNRLNLAMVGNVTNGPKLKLMLKI
jgi:predicted Zn-dependent peptidase